LTRIVITERGERIPRETMETADILIDIDKKTNEILIVKDRWNQSGRHVTHSDVIVILEDIVQRHFKSELIEMD